MRARLALAAAAASALVAPSAALANGGTLTGSETRITTNPADQFDPSISGDVVVYTDFRNGDADVYWTDLATMTEQPVVVAPGTQQLTDVSNRRIVYSDYQTYDVMLFDTATGTTTNLTAADKVAAGRWFSSLDPAISGDLVAWDDNRDGNHEIYAKDLATGEERNVSSSPAIDVRPAVGGGWIAWQRCAPGASSLVCDVYAYDWATGRTVQVTSTPTADESLPRVDGRYVVYQGNAGGQYDVYAYDLATGVVRQLALPGD